jgi:hypothetical protein
LSPTFDAHGEKLLSRDDVMLRSAVASVFLSPYLADPKFLEDPERRKVLGNFVEFVSEQRRMALLDNDGHHTCALGMDIPDRDYWEYVKSMVEFPALLKSQRFLGLMSNPATYQQAVSLIGAQNKTLPEDRKWIVLPFRAQFILSFDHTTYGRLLVLVPNSPLPDGKLLDQWIAFAIATPGAEPIPAVRSVSMIATVRDPMRPGVNQGYFADFLRRRDATTGETTIDPTFLMDPSPSKNCFDCHKTAVLPIHPKAAYRFGSDGRLVEMNPDLSGLPDLLNDRIRSYGKSDFGHIDPAAFGPSLGSGAGVSDTFIAQATSDHPLDPRSFDDVRSNMSCAKCHDQFAKLNYILAVRSNGDVNAFEGKKGLVQTYIEKGYMPPNNHLNPDERHALWECVMKQYFDGETGSGTFVDWLKGRS